MKTKKAMMVDRWVEDAGMMLWVRRHKPFGPWVGKADPAKGDKAAWLSWRDGARRMGWDRSLSRHEEEWAQSPFRDRQNEWIEIKAGCVEIAKSILELRYGNACVKPSTRRIVGGGGDCEDGSAISDYMWQSLILRDGVASLAKAMVDENHRQPDPPAARSSPIPAQVVTGFDFEQIWPLKKCRSVFGEAWAEGEFGIRSVEAFGGPRGAAAAIAARWPSGSSGREASTTDLGRPPRVLRLKGGGGGENAAAVPSQEAWKGDRGPTPARNNATRSSPYDVTGGKKGKSGKGRGVGKPDEEGCVQLTKEAARRRKPVMDDLIWQDLNLLGDDHAEVYHETQVEARCGLHTVNNMLQAEVWSHEDMLHFAKKLDDEWGGTHASNSGWYSIETLGAALASVGCEYHTGGERDSLDPSRARIGTLIHNEVCPSHWWGLRDAGSITWLHDSLHKAPAPVKSREAAVAECVQAGCTVIVVSRAKGDNRPFQDKTAEAQQRRRTPKEHQIVKDAGVAEAAQRELLRCWQTSPPPFTGPSPRWPSQQERENGEGAKKGQVRSQEAQAGLGRVTGKVHTGSNARDEAGRSGAREEGETHSDKGMESKPKAETRKEVAAEEGRTNGENGKEDSGSNDKQVTTGVEIDAEGRETRECRVGIAGMSLDTQDALECSRRLSQIGLGKEDEDMDGGDGSNEGAKELSTVEARTRRLAQEEKWSRDCLEKEGKMMADAMLPPMLGPKPPEVG